jgi:hypothetical protein
MLLAMIVETKERQREKSNMHMMSRVEDDKYEKHRLQVKRSKLRVYSVVVVGLFVMATLGLAAGKHLDHPQAQAILEHPSTKAIMNRSKAMASGIHKTLKDAAHHHFDGHWPSKLRGATMTPKKLRGATTKPLHPHNSVGKNRVPINRDEKPKANEEQHTMSRDEQKSKVEAEERTMAHEEQNTLADQRV